MCCTDGDIDNITETKTAMWSVCFWIYLHKMESHYFSLFWLFCLLLRMSYTPDSKSHTKHNGKKWNSIHHKVLLVIIIPDSERTRLQLITSIESKCRYNVIGRLVNGGVLFYSVCSPRASHHSLSLILPVCKEMAIWTRWPVCIWHFF